MYIYIYILHFQTSRRSARNYVRIFVRVGITQRKQFHKHRMLARTRTLIEIMWPNMIFHVAKVDSKATKTAEGRLACRTLVYRCLFNAWMYDTFIYLDKFKRPHCGITEIMESELVQLSQNGRTSGIFRL